MSYGLSPRDCAETSLGLAKQETVMQGLTRRREQAAKALADFDSAIALLNEQPKLLETLETLRRVGV